MINMIHLAARRSQLNAAGPFTKALSGLDEPVALTVIEQARELNEAQILEKMRAADIVLTMWGSVSIPAKLADNPGKVRYVLNLTGTCRPYVPIEIIRSKIPVTNWGDAPAHCIAEGAMALLLTVMKDLRTRSEKIASGEWAGSGAWKIPSGTLYSLKLGLYGCGAIGSRFVEMIAPFKPELYVYDPYAEQLPESCKRVNSLRELFSKSEAIAIHAGLSDQTRGSVTSELLALLPDNGIIINTARGEIIDQDALFAELKKGRLRAGLDVLAGNDSLPPDHEARKWPNLILTCHDVASGSWPPRPDTLSQAEKNALDNIQRFARGDKLRFIMDERRYNLST